MALKGLAMWPWLLNMHPQNHKQIWYRVALCCLIGHLGFLVFSFRYQSRQPLNLTVFANARSTEVVFLPNYKRVPGAQDKLAQGKVGKMGQVGAVGGGKNSGKKAGLMAKQTVGAKSGKKASSGAGATSKSSGVSQVKLDTYTVPAKSGVRSKPARKSQSKVKSGAKLEESKLVAQVVSEAKSESKSEVKIAPEPVLAVTTKNLQPALKLIDQSESASTELSTETDNGPMYIGLGSEGVIALGREDLVAWQAAQELESVIVQTWRPPSGFSKELICQVQLTVGPLGQVVHFEIKQGSGVLAYDLSVRQALPKLIFPESVRGKILVIAFKQ